MKKEKLVYFLGRDPELNRHDPNNQFIYKISPESISSIASNPKGSGTIISLNQQSKYIKSSLGEDTTHVAKRGNLYVKESFNFAVERLKIVAPYIFKHKTNAFTPD